MLPRDAADPKRAFQEQFAALVKASGLSIRDIARRTRVGRSTIHGWQHGKSLRKTSTT
jgi:transposase